MACLILRSCTIGNTTVLVTNALLSPALIAPIDYRGQHIKLQGHGVTCFSVEEIADGICDCPNPVAVSLPVQENPLCNCTVSFQAYVLTPCNDVLLPTVYTTQNLYPYVGTTITFFGENANCYTVAGSLNIPQGISEVLVECVEACICVAPGCGCPDGFTLNPDGTCTGLNSVDPVINLKTYTAVAGSQACVSPTKIYGYAGGIFYEDISAKPFPIVSTPPNSMVLPSGLVDNLATPLLVTNTVTNSIWGNGAASCSNSFPTNCPVCYDWRLNKVGIWTNNAPAPLNEWIGFTFCEEILTTKTYFIGIAADDNYKLFVNGTLILDHTTGGFAFSSWKLIPITLQAGTNIFDVRGFNTGDIASLGFEIYDATLAEMLGITVDVAAGPVNDINTYLIFSTKDKIGQTWQTGEVSGYTCPDGFSLNTCDGITCSQIVTVPQLPCLTYSITICGITDLDPILTNTDLLAYTTGVYNLCVTGRLDWPTGCYCVTVAQAPVQSGLDPFVGTFGENYDCCESCTQVCYELTDCQDAVAPLLLCMDLSASVGKIIKIVGCGDICWNVAVADSCVDSIDFNGVVTEYETCLECLPAVPVPIPLELNLRRVKPGYYSPNSCITLEYLEKVNCTFAQQVYNEMLIKRYGITVCCDQDIDSWDIQKAVLDYSGMGDPSLCKSTLCYCPAPCLVDAIFTLVPTCVAPTIYNTFLTTPCIAPTLIDAEIKLLIDTVCNCYTVDLVVTPGSTEVMFLDCCCDVQTQIITGSTKICAAYPPISFGDAITVSAPVICGSEECQLPLPHPCHCYSYTKSILNISDDVAYTDCNGTPITLSNVITSTSFCSLTTPVGGINGTIVDLGICSITPCEEITAECLCYTINIAAAGTASFSFIDCNDVTVNIMITATGQICSKTLPVLTAPSVNNIDIVYSNTACTQGLCAGAVPDCVCYEIYVGAAATISSTNCAGELSFQLVSAGWYYVCAQYVPVIIGTPIYSVAALVADCGLGECIAPTPNPCVGGTCYTFDTTTITTVLFDTCDGISVRLFNADGISVFCSLTLPIFGAGTLTANGSCSADCINPGAICRCYRASILEASGTITLGYIDCSGVAQTVVVTGAASAPICARTVPYVISHTGLAATLDLTYSTDDCGLGQCI